MPQAKTRETRKYEVVKADGRWSAVLQGQPLASFVTCEAAITYACAVAREDARRGRLALVASHTSPQEFHCFTPVDSAAPPTRHLRLVSSR